MASLCGAVRRSILCPASIRAVISNRKTALSSTISRSYSRSLQDRKEEDELGKYQYQYPLAKEPPVVTRNQASKVSNEDHSRPSSTPFKDGAPKGGQDRFDRTGLSEFEIQQIRDLQRKLLPKQLSSKLTKIDTIPTHLPPVIYNPGKGPLTSQLTTLENGVRVVSKELPSSRMSCTVGVISDLGSRNEIHPQQRGVVSLLELLSFGTPTPLFPDPATFLSMEMGGAAHFCTTQREQSVHVLDVLRPHVEQAFLLLDQLLLQPLWYDEHIEHGKKALGIQAQDAPPEILLGEGLHCAAFGADQQLGRPHFLMQENPELNAQVVRNFWKSRFIDNPQHIVVGGVGIDHANLVDLAQRHFGHLKQVTPPQGSVDSIPSVYRGGLVHMERETNDEFIRLGLGLKVDGWHSDDLVTVCVLQTLLGGGSSFSAGGPGKGMYSRLYRLVLNKYTWAESAEAFGAFYNEGGIFGLSGSTKPEHAREMMKVFADHLIRLAKEPVSQQELDRARNMLRGNVLTQLESRLVLLEDLGRQVLTYGHAEEARRTCEKIQSVTAEDILKIAQKAIRAGPPSVAAVGPGASTKLPSHEEIASWLQEGQQ